MFYYLKEGYECVEQYHDEMDRHKWLVNLYTAVGMLAV